MTREGDDPERVGAELARALLVDGGGSGLDGFDGPNDLNGSAPP